MDNIAVYVTPSHQVSAGHYHARQPQNPAVKLDPGRASSAISLRTITTVNFATTPALFRRCKVWTGTERLFIWAIFSKSIAPSLRISYMVLPRPLLNVYLNRTCPFNLRFPLRPGQLHEFILSGHFETHLN